MGYRRKNYRIAWPEGHELAGLEVVLRGMRVKELGIIAGMRGMDPENPDLTAVDQVANVFARHLINWNYEEEDGTPIPATKESALEMDLRVLMQVVMKWAEVAADVPAPLPKGSSGGERFPVASIPMAPL